VKVNKVRDTKSYGPLNSVIALLSSLVNGLQLLGKKIGSIQTRRDNSCFVLC